MDQPVIELAERIILWQDHSHPNGYRPKLTMLIYPDGRMALEMNVFGTVFVRPYVKAECGHE